MNNVKNLHGIAIMAGLCLLIVAGIAHAQNTFQKPLSWRLDGQSFVTEWYADDCQVARVTYTHNGEKWVLGGKVFPMGDVQGNAVQETMREVLTLGNPVEVEPNIQNWVTVMEDVRDLEIDNDDIQSPELGECVVVTVPPITPEATPATPEPTPVPTVEPTPLLT